MNSVITIEDIVSATNGLPVSTHSVQFEGVGTDSRKSLKNQLFIALKGDNFDAHNFLEQAVISGATGILVHTQDEAKKLELQQTLNRLSHRVTIILVQDTLKALQQLSRHVRQSWGRPIIAITGSNGKTTTKEFAAQILSVYKKVHYNQGSYNNHWGLPLTLLNLNKEHEVAICEMGMNHKGEIHELVKIAEPNIVGVTMVGRAHLEGLGSIQSVAQAKEEIYESSVSPPTLKRIFNLDNNWTRIMFDKYQKLNLGPIYTFSSQNSNVDVHFEIEQMTMDSIKLRGHVQKIKGSAIVPVFGMQNLNNLMFAACAALAYGLTPDEIWKALPQCKTIWGRNQKISHSTGAEILFDGYNANPDSQKALVENIQHIQITRPIVGIFGEMRELGAQSPSLHEELGTLVAGAPFKQVFFVGHHGESFMEGFSKGLSKNREHHMDLPNKEKVQLKLYQEVDSFLIEEIQKWLPEKPLITIKGSRGVKLEKILKELQINI